MSITLLNFLKHFIVHVAFHLSELCLNFWSKIKSMQKQPLSLLPLSSSLRQSPYSIDVPARRIRFRSRFSVFLTFRTGYIIAHPVAFCNYIVPPVAYFLFICDKVPIFSSYFLPFCTMLPDTGAASFQQFGLSFVFCPKYHKIIPRLCSSRWHGTLHIQFQNSPKGSCTLQDYSPTDAAPQSLLSIDAACPGFSHGCCTRKKSPGRFLSCRGISSFLTDIPDFTGSHSDRTELPGIRNS